MEYNDKLSAKEKIMRDVIDAYNSGIFPKREMFSSRNKTIARYFGNFYNLLKECKIEIPEEKKKYFNTKQFSKEEMIAKVEKFAIEFLKKNNRLPYWKEFNSNKDTPSPSTIKHHFGVNLEEFYEKYCNINSEKINSEEIKLKEQIKKMKKDMLYLSKKLGKIPTHYDIDKYCKEGLCYSTSTYVRVFGSIINAQEQCGVGISKTSKTRLKTKKDLIRELQQFYKKLNRPITQADIKHEENLSGNATYRKVFGSFQNALKEAGLPYNEKKKFVLGDLKFRSWYEYKFALMLEKYNVPYDSEIYYKDVNSKIKKRYRFDFVVTIENDAFCFVELFGISNYEKYDQRKKDKINLVKRHDIPLIQFSPKEMVDNFHDIDKIYKVYKRKLKNIKNATLVNKNVITYSKLSNKQLIDTCKKLTKEEIVSLLEEICDVYPNEGDRLKHETRKIINERNVV